MHSYMGHTASEKSGRLILIVTRKFDKNYKKRSAEAAVMSSKKKKIAIQAQP